MKRVARTEAIAAWKELKELDVPGQELCVLGQGASAKAQGKGSEEARELANGRTGHCYCNEPCGLEFCRTALSMQGQRCRSMGRYSGTEDTLRLLDPVPASRVLELGCGS